MKYLLNLVIILALGASIMSCGNRNNSVVRVRAIDAITEIPTAIKADTSIYKAGDTVWVNINYMTVSKKTHLYINTVDFRKYVIQP